MGLNGPFLFTPRYFACSSVSSVKWPSNVGKCNIATYSSKKESSNIVSPVQRSIATGYKYWKIDRSVTDCLTVPPTWQATSPCICIKEENDPCSGRLVDKNESWIANWLNLEDGLNHWFIWGFNDWLSFERLTASPDWLMDWLTDWLTHWLIDWLTDWLTDGLTDWQTEWLNDWLYVIFLDQNDHRRIDWPVHEYLTVFLSVCLSPWLTGHNTT